MNTGVLTGTLGCYDIAVTVFANLLPGKSDRVRGHFGESISAVVTVLPETVRHENGAQYEENGQSRDENCGQPEEVFGVL